MAPPMRVLQAGTAGCGSEGREVSTATAGAKTTRPGTRRNGGSAEPPPGAARLTGPVDDPELLELDQLLADLEHGRADAVGELLGLRVFDLGERVDQDLGEGL